MPPFAPFSSEDFETLGDWLVRRGKGIFDVVELEGFLTAIIIGPNALSPLAWLPKVWGGKQPTKFKDLGELNRFMALVMGFYNSIAVVFETAPREFEPTFYESRGRGKKVIVVDEWCVGFVKGVRMDSSGWKRLRREKPELLRPIELFGTAGGRRECEASGETKMHALWSPRIAPAVRAIYAFWLPHRKRVRAPPAPLRH